MSFAHSSARIGCRLIASVDEIDPRRRSRFPPDFLRRRKIPALSPPRHASALLAVGIALLVLASPPALAETVDAKKPQASGKPLNLHPAPKRLASKRAPPKPAPRASLPDVQALGAKPAPGQTGAAPATKVQAALGAQGANAPAGAARGAAAPNALAAAPAPAQPVAANAPPAASPDQPKIGPEARPSIPPIVSLPAATAEPRKADVKPPGPQVTGPTPQPSEAQLYCSNIAATAADARFAWQAKRLADLETQLKQRISELEIKQAEYKEWLQKREEFQKKAEDNVVAIYSRMRPEAAASQLAAMEDVTAAAILAKLNARSAGAILNEMDAARAARLTDAMAGLPSAARNGKKS